MHYEVQPLLQRWESFMSISGVEWVLIFVVALLLFGPKKLPELGRAVGKGIREFKRGMNGLLDEEEKKEQQQVQVKENESVKTP
jgi:sec-independent protein translocase protein TatA